LKRTGGASPTVSCRVFVILALLHAMIVDLRLLKIENRQSKIRNVIVPVAQLDRASDFGSEGWGFESLQARNCF
jgi:hypothetical protein